MSKAEKKAARSLLRIRGLYSWGSSQYGQLGLGPEVREKSIPTSIPSFENVQQFAASGSFSVVLKVPQVEKSQVYAFGRNNNYQLGLIDSDEQITSSKDKPRNDKQHDEAGADENQSIAQVGPAGSSQQDGIMYSPRSSTGTARVILNMPKLIDALSNHRVIQVACGGTHAAALTSQGKMFSWGRGKYGQLGLGEEVLEQVVPREVTEMDGVHIASIQAGDHHTVIITKSNAIYTCGMGTYGQLGHQDFENRYVPTRVEYFEEIDVMQAAVGHLHTAVLTAGGAVYTWGSNEFWQLGYMMPDDNHDASTTESSKEGNTDETSPISRSISALPRKIEFFSHHNIKVKQVSCGHKHTLVLSLDGQLFVFGMGENGELGLGGSIVATKPTQIEELLGLSIARCYAATGFSAYITDTGELWYTGKFPGADKSSIPRRFPSPFPDAFFHSIACGTDHILALIDTGDLWRNRTIGRLLAIERSFVKNMSLISREITPVAEAVVGKETWDSIVGKQEELVKYHSRNILKRLDAVIEQPTQTMYPVGAAMADLFSDSKLLSLYTEYASNFSKSWEKFLSCIKTVPSLGSYIEACLAKPIFYASSLVKYKNPEQFVAFLQLPNFHFSELLPQLEDLLRFTPETSADYAEVAKAQKMCKEATMLVKGSLAGSPSFLGLLNFVKLYPLYQDLLQTQRRFVMKASYLESEKSTPGSHKIYIFSDLVILATPEDIEYQIPISDVFVREVVTPNVPTCLLVTPTQSHRLCFESRKKKSKIVDALESTIDSWLNQSPQNKEHRSLIAIRILTNNLEMVMPLLSKSWKYDGTMSPRSPSEDQSSSQLSIISSNLFSMSDLISKTCSAMENDRVRQNRIPLWGYCSLFPTPSLSSRNRLTSQLAYEPFIVYIDIPQLVQKEKKFSSFSKAFTRKKKRQAIDVLYTNLGTTQAGTLTQSFSSMVSGETSIDRKFRIAVRVPSDMTVGEAKAMLYKAALESPWAESLQLGSLQEYVMRVKGINFYLSNENLTLARVPLLQSIMTISFVAPFIEMVSLTRAAANSGAIVSTVPKGGNASLFTPTQPKPNLDAEISVFEEMTTLVGDLQSILVPTEEVNSFRHAAAGLRLQLLTERRQNETSGAAPIVVWPEFKGLEAMPSKLPTKLTLTVYLPHINNEKYTLQVPPDASVEFVQQSIFRYIYKHEKHKTREKITKFMKRIIDTDVGDSTSSEAEEEEVEYKDPKEFDLTGATAKTGETKEPTEAPANQIEEPHASNNLIELPDKPKKSRLANLAAGLRSSWKKEEDEEPPLAGPLTPSSHGDSVLSSQSSPGILNTASTAPIEPLRVEVRKQGSLASTGPIEPLRGEARKQGSLITITPRGQPSPVAAPSQPQFPKRESMFPERTGSASLIPTRKATPDSLAPISAVPSNDTASLKLTREGIKRESSKKKEFVSEAAEVEDKLEKLKKPKKSHSSSIIVSPAMASPSKTEDLESRESSTFISSVQSGEGDDSPRRTRPVQTEGEKSNQASASPLKNSGKQELDQKPDDESNTIEELPNEPALIGESSGLTDGESDEDGSAGPSAGKLRKKEEERLKKLKKEEGKRQKKEVERQKKEAKKAIKDIAKKAKKDGLKAKKEEKKEKKKQKHLHNGKEIEDFILKVNGAKEFLLPGMEDDRPTLLCDYDYIRKSISNQTSIELRFIAKSSTNQSAVASSYLSDYEEQLIERSIARSPQAIHPKKPTDFPGDGQVDDEGSKSTSHTLDTDVIEIYLDDRDVATSAKPFWSLREDRRHFKIKVLECEGVGTDFSNPRSNMFVIAVLHYGVDQMRIKTMTPMHPFTANPVFNNELVFNIRACDVPRESRLTLAVYARTDTGNMKSKILSTDIPLAWATTMLFDHQSSLKHGIHGLRLWPGKPSLLGPSSENNVDKTAPILLIDVYTSSGYDSQPQTLRKKNRSLSPTYQSPFHLPFFKDSTSYTSSNNTSIEDIHSLLSSSIPSIADMPTEKEQLILAEIAQRDPIASVTQEEAALLLKFKGWLKIKLPEILPKLLLCVDWSDREMVKEIHTDLDTWPVLPPILALQLLDSKYADVVVRTFAVNRCLSRMSNNEIYRILLQLVQAIKYEPYHNSALTQLLLKRAFWDSRRIGHFFFWHLKSEMHDRTVAERFSLMLEAFTRSCGHYQRAEFIAHSKVLTWIHHIAVEIKGRKGTLSNKTNKLHDRLAKADLPDRFNYPLDPRIECCGFDIEHCRVLGSKTVPLLLTFKTAEPLTEPLQMIYKIGDDLRQDALTLQIIHLMDDLWKKEGLDLRLKPYACMALGPDCGIIEVVKNANTTSNINIELGGLRAVYNDSTLLKWLKKHNPTEKMLNKAIENFIYSCAGYSVITFVLGFADRHNDNIMLSKQGHLFHIDFGHFLGHYRKFLGKYVDKAELVFMNQYEGVIGKENYPRFANICAQAYNIIRNHSNQFITLFCLMLASGLPELQSEADIEFIKDRLQLHLSPDEAAEFFKRKLIEGSGNSTIKLNHAFHVVYQGMRN